MASGVAASLPILAAIAPRPGSTVPISKPQRRVTDSKTVNSHRFRRATPLNTRRSILMTSNLRSSVLLQNSTSRSQTAPARARHSNCRHSSARLNGSCHYLVWIAVKRRALMDCGYCQSSRLKRPGAMSQLWLRALVANHPSVLTYAATCFDSGVVRISMRRGKAAAATGAVISSTPF